MRVRDSKIRKCSAVDKFLQVAEMSPAKEKTEQIQRICVLLLSVLDAHGLLGACVHSYAFLFMGFSTPNRCTCTSNWDNLRVCVRVRLSTGE